MRDTEQDQEEINNQGTYKEIKHYEQLYVINKKGIIYSISNKPIKKIKPYWDNTAKCYVVELKKDHCYRIHRLHRLIAQTFLENPQKRRYVRFIDGNKKNCSLENLFWSNQYCATNIEEFKSRGRYKSKMITSKNDTTSSISSDHQVV